MSFEHPAALWALASLALLVLFSLWRQAAARVTVPSLALWRKIPERNPPVRALRRPRWRFELFLQALAIAAAVAALAGPYRETSEPKPRRVAFVFDTSARMRAGNRLFKAGEKAGQLELKLKGDEVKYYASLPSPQRLDDRAGLHPVDVHVELEPLLAAARGGADHVILFSDRPADGATPALFAAPADNAGIVEFSAGDEEVFVRIVDRAPARPLPIELIAGDLKIRETLPPGARVWSRRGDFSKAASVRVSLDVADSFPLDNVVEAARLAGTATTVSVSGLAHPQVLKALRSIPGVSLRSGEGAAKLAIGIDAAPGPADLRIWLIPSPRPLEGEAVIAKHPLMADLEKRGGELARVCGELPAGDGGGEPLITIGGKVAAALRGRELRICVDVNEWGKSLPSLPIFFANAVDLARSGASGFAVLRTGRPFALPPGSAIRKSPEVALAALSPEGIFVAHTVGDYVLQTPSGERTLRANLLDERESDSVGEERELAWDPGSPAGRERSRL
ncbi:MAG: BatA domain-containing protein [Planctomycetes bacterium]|nr:BatA domain-containing protein [Planctomycetota bacterium]